MNHRNEFMFIDLFPAKKKKICRFVLNMYIFIKSPAFSPPFKLFHDMSSLFFILLSFLQ